MLIAVKECLKNWLATHERLYWYIVVGLAVLGFGIVTALGCAKLEKANAAETRQYTVTWGNGSKTFEVADGQYYAYLHWVSGSGRRNYMFMTSSEPFDLYDYSDGTYGISSPAGGSMWKTVSEDGGSTYEESYSDFTWQNMYGIGAPSAENVYSNCDIVTRNTGGVVVYSANPLAAEPVYSLDAPYVKFESLEDISPLRDEVLNGWQYATESLNVRENPNASSYWIYHGRVANLSSISDLSNLMLEVSFEVKLPSYSWLVQKLDYEGLLCGEISSDAYDGRIKKAVSDFDNAKDIPCDTYRFVYLPTLAINGTVSDYILEDGTFSYFLTYEDILNYLFYFNENLREMYIGDSNIGLRNYLMAFAHIESTTSLVFLENDTESVYGRSVLNYYKRGSSSAVSAEVMADVFNATAEELEKAISDALAIGYDNALGESQGNIDDLQNRIEELENQIGGMTSIDVAFGSLEGSDLWSGFVGLTQGIGGMAPAVRSLSALTGSVLAFLPLQMSGIMATTMLAICVIAIIKAIRG